jgi:parvulin-like peptidyl-prolyl isomerase
MLRPLPLALLGLLLAACPKPASAPDAGFASAAAAKDVVATVNGVPIAGNELVLRVSAFGLSGEGDRAHALEALVTDELYAQEAKRLGYESEPSFLEAMARVEAQWAEVRRRELAKVYLHREILQKAAATDAEARAHFDAHPARFFNEVRVAQLVVKGQAAADAVQAELARGRSFDALAAELLGAVPAGEKPWELPWMAWAQVPPSWWPALDALQPGQVSAPFATAKDQWVVLKLLERRPVSADFEALKPFIQAQLKSDAIEAARRATEAKLRAAATIEVRPMAGPPVLSSPPGARPRLSPVRRREAWISTRR